MNDIPETPQFYSDGAYDNVKSICGTCKDPLTLGT